MQGSGDGDQLCEKVEMFSLEGPRHVLLGLEQLIECKYGKRIKVNLFLQNQLVRFELRLR